MRSLILLLAAACAGSPGQSAPDAASDAHVLGQRINAGLGLLSPTQRTGLALVASPPLTSGYIPFGDSGGNLAQSQYLHYDLTGLGGVAPLLVSPDAEIYTPSALSNIALGLRFGTGGSGNPNDDAHGVKVGIHYLATTGDVPGASYGFFLDYFDGRLNFGTGGSYYVSLTRDATGHAYWSPWDPQNGSNSRDGQDDLGRYTDSSVGGESYTRHTRWRDGYFSGAIRFGNKNQTTTPKIDASSTTVEIKLADGSAFAPLAASMVVTPRQQTVYSVVAGTTIPYAYGLQGLTESGNTTMTATPTITVTSIADGTRAGFVNEGVSNIVLQDEANLVGSKLKNGAGANFTLSAGAAVSYVFDSNDGFWHKF